MLIDRGDLPTGQTVPFFFPAYDSNGASVTITGLAVTDIEVYKGVSMTQRASDNGYALIDTDGIDLDSRTGIHGFSIDMSDNSDAGFYAAGSFYHVVVDAVTIDSQTVRFIFSFSLGFTLRPATAGRTLGVESDGDLTKVNTLDGHTAQTGDNYARLGAPAGASIAADIADNLTGINALNDLDAAAVRAAIGLAAANLDTQLATAQADLDTLTGSDGATLATSQPNYTPATAASLASLVTTVGASGAGLTEAGGDGDHLTEAGGTGDHLTAVPVMTTQMTESYNSDGTAPTPAQALFVIMQMLTEMSISGTTMTIKKIDGSTTAFTLTLDDGSTPTSVTRAT